MPLWPRCSRFSISGIRSPPHAVAPDPGRSEPPYFRQGEYPDQPALESAGIHQ